MSVEQRNPSGHQVSIPEAEAKGNGTAGEILALGNVVYVKAADGSLYKHDGNEAPAAAIVGVSDNAYSAAAPASYFQNGDVVVGLSGLTQGTEYWAKDDGSLDTYANIPSTKFTRLIGTALNATSLQLQIGEVTQKP